MKRDTEKQLKQAATCCIMARKIQML